MVDTLKNWECFCDKSYYDQWSIRHKDNKSFYATIHTRTKEEAEFLVDELNTKESLTAQLEEARKALEWFCKRVDDGEVRSKQSYSKFKAVLNTIRK